MHSLFNETQFFGAIFEGFHGAVLKASYNVEGTVC